MWRQKTALRLRTTWEWWSLHSQRNVCAQHGIDRLAALLRNVLEHLRGPTAIRKHLQVEPLPALTRTLPTEALPVQRAGTDGQAADAQDQTAQDDTKAAKLAAMQERMEAWKREQAASKP
jgi:hypothetical protein